MKEMKEMDTDSCPIEKGRENEEMIRNASNVPRDHVLRSFFDFFDLVLITSVGELL